MQNTGSRTTVNVSLNRSIEEAECSLCGQCITHCPVNALHVREDSERAFAAFNDPDKITIVQIAPAVRAAWGESLGLRREEATIEKLGDAFRRMGADYVFDTDFAADLTIMEEASEFLERLHHKMCIRDRIMAVIFIAVLVLGNGVMGKFFHRKVQES